MENISVAQNSLQKQVIGFFRLSFPFNFFPGKRPQNHRGAMLRRGGLLKQNKCMHIGQQVSVSGCCGVPPKSSLQIQYSLLLLKVLTDDGSYSL